MRIIGIVILVSLISVLSYAQDNDSATLRKNVVAEVMKMQFVHAFAGETDSCLMDHIKVDNRGRVTYHKVDMMCMGYESQEETFFFYKGDKLVSLSSIRDNENFLTSDYEYSDGKEPTAIRSFLFQTNDSMIVLNQYFRNRKHRMDSSYSSVSQPDGTVIKSRSYARYNKKKELVQLYTLNSDGTPREMVSNEVDDDGKVKSIAFTSYGDNPSFSQTFYEYNQDGKIANTLNTVNQKQEYFYNENGLLSNVLSYNPKGALEIEYIYKYKYYK